MYLVLNPIEVKSVKIHMVQRKRKVMHEEGYKGYAVDVIHKTGAAGHFTH